MGPPDIPPKRRVEGPGPFVEDIRGSFWFSPSCVLAGICHAGNKNMKRLLFACAQDWICAKRAGTVNLCRMLEMGHIQLTASLFLCHFSLECMFAFRMCTGMNMCKKGGDCTLVSDA